ncbi:sensor histidine kinase [Antrihabitans cavernicola]|uniref:histidine kinase n=1 Tax=Antrihabitans cavernicola TaxID=2495913 RepID=A0A5A7SDD4_9NOCA|nr:histidine kinase [Spelaeibacter cavernicola]KAA0023389.1 two-component sensor histidine kinase [Spelaeibacter cavernicola]
MRRWSELPASAQDAVIAVGAFCFGASLYPMGLFSFGDGPDRGLPVRFAVLALLCCATYFRRSIPIAALLGGLIPLAIDLGLGASVPIWLIYSDLIYAAVLYGSRTKSRAVVIASAVLSVVFCIGVGIVADDWRVLAVAMGAAVAFVGTPIWWAITVRTHKEIAESERRRAAAMAVVAQLDRQAAIADERNVMARDLHDVIAGHLSAIAIQSEAALAIARTDPKSVQAVLESVRANSIGALDEMHTMIGLLRSSSNDSDTTAPRRLEHLPMLVDSTRATGTEVTVLRTTDHPVPTAVDHTAYRIAQEALTNAMKHAPGRPVDVDVHAQSGRLLLDVSNALARHTPRAANSLGRGLTNMRERTELLGGTFEAGPGSGRWRVHVSLPLTAGAAR